MDMVHDIILASDLEGTFPYEEWLRTCITAALAAEQVALPCEINVLITDDQEICQINWEPEAGGQAHGCALFSHV